MIKQKWKIAGYVTLVIGIAFLGWAFTVGSTPLYAVAASWFALAAIFGRQAATTQETS